MEVRASGVFPSRQAARALQSSGTSIRYPGKGTGSRIPKSMLATVAVFINLYLLPLYASFGFGCGWYIELMSTHSRQRIGSRPTSGLAIES